MARPKGSPKLGGRVKGTPNKSKLFKLSKTAEVLAEAGKHPIEEILKLLPLLPPRDAVKVWAELHSYLESKPRQAESPAPDLEGLTDAQLLELVPKEVG